MLTINIPSSELFIPATNEFVTVEGKSLSLEHSLVSVSKWESKWHKPFFGNEPKTQEQVVDYIRCMTLTKNVDPSVYFGLTPENIKAIEQYIDDPMTATTFSSDKNKPNKPNAFAKNKKIITSELIYYWMIAYEVPMECQKWHLNRLLTLIRVLEIKNQPSKKMSKKDLYDRNRKLNAARRNAIGTTG